MSTTISGYHNTLQTLNPNTLAVTITGTINAGGSIAHGFGAVYGPQSGDFTLTNLGLIQDTEAASTSFANAGIVLGANGTITNHGTILGLQNGGEGVNLYRGGTVVNSGSIIAAAQAIHLGASTLASHPDFILNSGDIDATSEPFSISGGSALYDAKAIEVTGAGTVENSGTVGAQYGVGIDLAALAPNGAKGTPVTLAGSLSNTGTVKAQYGAAFEALGTFSNSGSIFGTAVGAQVYAGTLVNSGSLIGGNAGIIGYGGIDVVNSGSIAATDSNGFSPVQASESALYLYPAGVILLQGGQVSNAASGVISGIDGVQIDSVSLVSSALVNAGKILGAYYGVRVENYVTTGTTGTVHGGPVTITNSGLIDSAASQTVDPGAPSGAAGILITSGGEIINQAGGTIIGYTGISALQASVSVDNLGLVSGSGSYSAIDLGAGGQVTNAGTLMTQALLKNKPNATSGILLGPTGSATNTSTGGTGYFSNSGKIEVETQGFAALGSASMSNSGLITIAAQSFAFNGQSYFGAGIALSAGGKITNAGSVLGGDAGIIAYGTAAITNSGSIAPAGTKPVTVKNGMAGTLSLDPTGIALLRGGAISNAASGIISSAAGYGVELKLGGSLANAGKISGAAAGVLAQGAAVLANSGTISASGTTLVIDAETLAAAAILVTAAASISNSSGGTITGLEVGIEGTASITISNAGRIAATATTFKIGGTLESAVGALLAGGGTFSNAATGIVSGYAGFVGEAGAMLINAGTITGLGSIAVELIGAGGKVVDDPGAVFKGLVEDIAGSGTLELASGKSATIAAFNSIFSGFGTVDIDAGANWAVAGTLGTVLDDGTLAIASGSSLDIGTLVNAASTGLFLLTGKASLEIASVLGSAAQIEFLAATPTSTLAIDNTASFGLNIGKSNYAGPLLEDFKAGDVIDLKNLAATGLKLNYNASTGDLQITNSSGGVVATLQFQNSSLGPGSFQTATDNAHGALLTLT
jgi:hypothetical protein